MRYCEKCGVLLEDEKENCPGCGERIQVEAPEEEKPVKDAFKVLYDIGDFDDLEEGKFEANRKRKIRKSIIATVLVLVLAVFVSIKLSRSMEAQKNIDFSDNIVNREQVEDKAENSESTPVENTETQEEGPKNNDVDALKQEVKRICSNYNNSRPPYDGDLIAVVKDGTNITATYIISNAVSSAEKDRVAEVEEEIKNMFSEKLKEKFTDEVNVGVKMIVSYRD